MQKKLTKLKELYNKVIDLIVEENFKNIPETIRIIKNIINSLEEKEKNNNSTIKQEKILQNSKVETLEKQIKKLEERIIKLEKLRMPSMQISENTVSNSD
jgi:polyhydroxyalkanoate synthesis regulator phasin